MLLNDQTGKHGAPQRQGRSSRRVIPIVTGIVSVVLVAGALVIAKQHFDDSAPAGVGTSTTTTPSMQTTIINGKPITPPKFCALTFDATFHGSQLDSKVWATLYPWSNSVCTNF